MKGSQIWTNGEAPPTEGVRRGPRRGILVQFSKIFFSRAIHPGSSIFGMQHLWEEDFQVCTNEGAVTLRGPTGGLWNSRFLKIMANFAVFKNLLLKNQAARSLHILYVTSLAGGVSRLYKWRGSGILRPHKGTLKFKVLATTAVFTDHAYSLCSHITEEQLEYFQITLKACASILQESLLGLNLLTWYWW